MQLISIIAFFLCVQNAVGQLTLPWTEDFEGATAGAYTTNQAPIPGLTGTGYSWEADLGTGGRLRTNAGAGFNHGGNRAITLDRASSGSTVANYLIGNLDLSNYAGVNDLELTFWFSHHGEEPHANDRVWIRGSTSDPWVEVYNLYTNRPTTGQYKQVTLDIDALMSSAGQTITATFQIRFGQEDNFPANSPTGSDGFSFDDISITGSIPTNNNTGVTALLQPNPPMAAGFNTVEVEVTNFGLNSLSSFNIEWEVAGVAQPTYVYSGPSIPTGNTTNIILGNVNFPTTPGNMTFWTTMPNGQTDEDLSNDTLDVGFCTGLSGTYTVGHALSDFPTAAMALDALMNCGVSGPVTMEFQGGTYVGPWSIGTIPGVNATNTITFDGMDATTTILTHDGTGTNQAATLTLDGAEYFTIKNFRIQSTGTSRAYGVLLTNTAQHNVIEDNVIAVPVSTSLNNVVAVLASASYTNSTGVATEGKNSRWNVIKDNDISGGVSGIILEGGQRDSMDIGNQIIGNTIHDAQRYGIYVDEQDSLVISGNKVYDILAGGSDAMMLFDIMHFAIVGNEVTALDYGIAVQGGFSDPCRNGVIINNMVSSNDEALFLSRINLIQVYHNTFSGGNRTCFISGHINVDFRNNIAVTTSGTCFFTFDNANMSGMDHNLYHATAGGNAVRFGPTTYATLADWQTTSGTGYDMNSVTGNPGFINGLHVISALPVDAADPNLLVPVLVDIDGESRPMGSTPDIGADEHVVVSDDAMAVGLISPSGCGSAAHDVIVEIANLGTNTLLSAPITVNVTGAATANFNTTQPLINVGTSAQVNMGTLNTNAGGMYHFEIIVSSSVDTNQTNDTVRVSVNINPSNQMALTMVGDTMVCDSSTAMIAATASYAPSTILWYDSAVGGNLIHIGASFTTGTLDSTTMYYAEIQGCNSPRAVATVSLDTVGIQVDLGGDQSICGGTAARLTPTVSLSSATSLTWSTGAQSAFIDVYISGDYTATVMNANGCTDTDTVNVSASPVPNVGSSIVNVSCGGGSNGSIDLTVTGGVSPYTYEWNTTAVTEDIVALSGGIYSVTVTDSLNCTHVAHFQVNEPTALSVNVDGTSMACNGNDGGVDITVSGGTPGYTYNWSTSSSNEDLTNAPAGTHTVTITDANGCTSTASGTVSAATPIVIVVDTIYAEILAIKGGIDITATGGSGNLQYVWNTGVTTDDITDLVAGSYDVTVTDMVTGCQQVLSGIVVPYQIPDMVNTISSVGMLKVYPNPSTGYVWVDLELNSTEEVELELRSVTGQLLQSFEPREGVEQHYQLDMSAYPSGVYLAKFVIGGEVMTTKIIVE